MRCHCEPARRLVWCTDQREEIPLGCNFLQDSADLEGIPTPVCALARNDSIFGSALFLFCDDITDKSLLLLYNKNKERKGCI